MRQHRRKFLERFERARVGGERVAIDSEYNRHFSRMHGHG